MEGFGRRKKGVLSLTVDVCTQVECDKVAFDKRFPPEFQLTLFLESIEAGLCAPHR